MKRFRAIDLFAGIGGIRLGFKQAFGDQINFVFSCEIDEYARKTYNANFNEISEIDIRKYPIKEINDFDILLAGFPCQSFSKAGKREGFKGKYGNFFFYIHNILKQKAPYCFFLENVENLINHDGGRTFFIIKNILESELKYYIHYEILNARDFGLPQNRKRIFIVGFKDNIKFQFPKGNPNPNISISDILENKTVNLKYYLSQQYLNTLMEHRRRHKSRGHGFGYQVISPDGIANTLVCGGMGNERNLIKDEIFYEAWKDGDDPLKKKNASGIRRMTEREWARLQGFDDSFQFPVPMSHVYKQVAKSVPIPVIKTIAEQIKDSLIKKEILKSERKIQTNLIEF